MEGCLLLVFALLLDWGITSIGVWIIWSVAEMFFELPVLTIGIQTAIWIVIKVLKLITT